MICILTGVNRIVHKMTRTSVRTRAANSPIRGSGAQEEVSRFCQLSRQQGQKLWTEYAGKAPADLQFKVTWIGFWFNIPGFTSDPTEPVWRES